MRIKIPFENKMQIFDRFIFINHQNNTAFGSKKKPTY
jgi:hypothetical protein